LKRAPLGIRRPAGPSDAVRLFRSRSAAKSLLVAAFHLWRSACRLLDRKGRRMIYGMNRRIAGFVAALGLAAAVSRPALAQSPGSDWFEGTADPSTPPPDDAAPSAPGDEAPAPPDGDSQVSEPTAPPPSAPGPQGADANIPETDPRALTEFRPTLDPYGTWQDDARYGTVWVPNADAVGSDFAPYVSGGHWALSGDSDWVWQSDYPFGQVVFHYGRWVWVPGTGWAWVAGRQYANAWVNWRVPIGDYGYVGWAPMPPAWGWYGGSAVSLGWYPPAAYVFCPSNYAFSYHVNSYIVHDRYVIHDLAAHTRNYSASAGGHMAASPRVLPANSRPPRGPSLQSAHVAASAAPRMAGSAFVGSHGAAQGLRVGSAYSGPRPSSNASYASGYARSSSSGPGNVSSYSRPSSYSNPGYANSYSRPSSYSNPSSYSRASSYSNPSSYSRPSSYSNPSSYARPASVNAYRAAPARSYYSAPSVAPRAYVAPSVSARSYSAPAAHYSAPAAHFSAPSPAYSAPSVHFHSRR
jgi:hypothetical protein